MERFKILKAPNQTSIQHIRAKCCKEHLEFIIRLEFNKGYWYMVYATKKENVLSEFMEKKLDNRLKLDNGIYVGKDYACPYCGNKSIVRCGRCGHITCKDNGKFFKCDYCDNSGEVSGQITSVYVEQALQYTKK
jgi:hypothetical protein